MLLLITLYFIVSGVMYIRTDYHDYGFEALSSPDGYIFMSFGLGTFLLDFFV